MTVQSILVKKNEVNVSQEPWGTLQWLVSGATGTSEKLTVGRVTINPGMSNPHHMHPNCEEVLYVISGKVSHTMPDGTMVAMRPGDSIVIPPNVWHHAENMGDEPAIVLVSFDSAWRETIGE